MLTSTQKATLHSNVMKRLSSLGTPSPKDPSGEQGCDWDEMEAAFLRLIREKIEVLCGKHRDNTATLIQAYMSAVEPHTSPHADDILTIIEEEFKKIQQDISSSSKGQRQTSFDF